MDFFEEYKNKYVIVKSDASGVHAGYVKFYDPATRHIILTDSRRLYQWVGFTLSDVAIYGVILAKNGINQEPITSDYSVPVEEIIIADVVDFCLTTSKSEQSIKEHPNFEPPRLLK